MTGGGRIRLPDPSAIEGDRITLMMTFVTAAEHLSFAEAATHLNVMPSTISRQISRLEDRLGVRLFTRTTRRVALTEAGEAYYREALAVLARIAEVDDIISNFHSEPRGTLRISAPVALGRLYVNAIVLDFITLYRDLQVEVDYSDTFVDIVRDGYDVVIRTGELADSGLIARRIATNRRILVAAPKYIAKHGVPATPQDLVNHNCVRFTYYSAAGRQWQFTRGEEEVTVTISGNFVSNNSDTVAHAVQHGVGIGLLAGYLAVEGIRNGDLVQLLPEWTNLPEAGVYFLYANGRHLPPKVRAFISFVEGRLRGAEWNTDRVRRKLLPAPKAP
ncbi:LysR family transcriptional regulator [Acuticoccus mangrovi]|uniref:LysR family transcriptional regulator n=1 Tax=Acuticoccus mangrovi TaxID=2796142 RepID=A0A934IQE6_9HYPH|nr:LysR family transcriptional regulator [Acuticoccus mangrovi]MBJ3776796.1 LysR family transcriptional regulator [Acuticoccus mangrovi]